MSTEPTKPDVDILSLLRELIRLRRRELELLRRLERQMLIAAALAPPAVAPPAVAPPRSGAPDHQAAAEAGTASPADREPRAERDAGGVVPHPASSPSIPPSDRDWIDRTIEAALARAFSGQSTDGRDLEEGSLPPPAPADDPDLLLVRGGDAWIGFPWERVQGIGLAEEEPGGIGQSVSLRALLELPGEDEAAAEPYRVAWDHDGASVALTCEALGGVVPASAAASRGLELVVVPGRRAGAPGCCMQTLVEFLAGYSDELPAEEGGPGPAPATVEDAPPRSPAPVRLETFDDLPVHADRSRDPSPAAPSAAAVPAAAVPAVVRDRTAVIAVRYLPARVALTRVLRTQGWQITELADPGDLPGHLASFRATAVFAEPPDGADLSWLEALRRAQSGGARLFAVGSRLRGRAVDPLASLGEVPRLLYPYQEWEIERVVGALGAVSPEP